MNVYLVIRVDEEGWSYVVQSIHLYENAANDEAFHLAALCPEDDIRVLPFPLSE